MLDLKCGNCETCFPVKLDSYVERCKENRSCSPIYCPSCMSEVPKKLIENIFEFAISRNDFNNWEIGLRFPKDHKCR